MKPQSLYDQNKAIWDDFAGKGFTNLARMAQHFARCSDMDRALGYTNATAAWVRGRGLPPMRAEVTAGLWLGQMPSDEPAATPKAEPTAPIKPSGVLLLVACDAAIADKVKRVIGILGAEIEEI